MPAAVKGWMEKFLFRNQGAVSLHLAAVAAGMIDGAVSVDCKLWDIAAAALLIEEAGGVITDLNGKSIWPVDVESYDNRDMPVVAGHRALHEFLITNLSGQ
jgi:fructose-1,6-bisphosphatase/inositol monophosphatase family enzyme